MYKYNMITYHTRVPSYQSLRYEGVASYLADHVLVGEANNHAVLRRVVLILVLNDETLACVVVSLSFCYLYNRSTLTSFKLRYPIQ